MSYTDLLLLKYGHRCPTESEIQSFVKEQAELIIFEKKASFEGIALKK